MLAYITVAYNVVEGIVSIWAGLLAGSYALLSFGTDSFIESLSGIVIIWRLKGARTEEGLKGRRGGKNERWREGIAVKLVGASLLLLGLFVLIESLKKIYYGEPTEPSVVGIAVAVASIIVMPILARVKRRTGREAGLNSIIADSRQTSLCAYLSAALLTGLLLNYLFNITWADPVTALIITTIIIKEGIEIIREGVAEEGCC